MSVSESRTDKISARLLNMSRLSHTLFRDVQCISCDKDVVMKTEQICGFRSEPLPSTYSTRPYLTYELDQIRKQQRKLPHSRNMIQFEAAIQETKKIKTTEEISR